MTQLVLKLKNDEKRIQALTVDYKGTYVSLDDKVFATFEFSCDKNFFKDGFEGYFSRDKELCEKIVSDIEKEQERVDNEKKELYKRLKENKAENLIDFFNYLRDNNLTNDWVDADSILKAYLDDKETTKETKNDEI